MSRAAVGAARIEMDINSAFFERQMQRMDQATNRWRRSLQNVERQFIQTGRNLERSGRNMMRTVTGPIVAMTTGLIALQRSTGNYADQLLDLSQITGISTDALQEWRNVARVAGVDADAVSNAVSGLSRRIRGVSEESGAAYQAFQRLGISQRFIRDNINDTDTIMRETIERLSQMDAGLDRAALAGDLFGRRWEQIAPILGMTAQEIEHARNQAHDLGMVMDREALEAVNKFRIEMAQLGERIAATGRKIAVDLLPLVQNELIPAFEKLLQSTTNLVNAFGSLDASTQRSILRWGAILTILGPVRWAIGKVVTGVGNLIGYFRKLSTLVGGALIPKIAGLGSVIASVAIFTQNMVDNSRISLKELRLLWDMSVEGIIRASERLVYALNRAGLLNIDILAGFKMAVIRAGEATEESKKKFLEAYEGLQSFEDSAEKLRNRLQDLWENMWSGLKAVDETTESTDRATQSMNNYADSIERANRATNAARPRVAATAPTYDVYDPSVEKVKNEFVEIGELVSQIESHTPNFAEMLFPPGSMGYIRQQINDLQHQLMFATNTEHIRELRGQIADLELELQGTSQAMNFLHQVSANFVDNFGRGMANVVMESKRFVDLLSNMKRLLLSSTIQSGISAFLTGGLGGSGFFGEGGGLLGSLGRAIGIPGMKRGGIVPSGFPNDTYPAMLSSGERVIPAPIPLSGNDPGLAGKMKISGQFRIKGTDLVLLLEEANQRLQ